MGAQRAICQSKEAVRRRFLTAGDSALWRVCVTAVLSEMDEIGAEWKESRASNENTLSRSATTYTEPSSQPTQNALSSAEKGEMAVGKIGNSRACALSV